MAGAVVRMRAAATTDDEKNVRRLGGDGAIAVGSSRWSSLDDVDCKAHPVVGRRRRIDVGTAVWNAFAGLLSQRTRMQPMVVATSAKFEAIIVVTEEQRSAVS